jgi:hypothetical protein
MPNDSMTIADEATEKSHTVLTVNQQFQKKQFDFFSRPGSELLLTGLHAAQLAKSRSPRPHP